jgi:hypothetical protein
MISMISLKHTHKTGALSHFLPLAYAMQSAEVTRTDGPR